VEIAMRIVTVLAATALFGSTVVQAQQLPPDPGSVPRTQTAPSPAPGQKQDQLQLSPDRRAEPDQRRSGPEDDVSTRVASRLAQFKEALRLTPDQEKNWPAFDAGLREFAKLLLERSTDQDQPPSSHVERLRRNAERLGTMSAALTRLADVEEPLYKSLNDGQKERFVRLARQARRDVVELVHNSRTGARDEDRSRYGRGDEAGRRDDDGRDDDDRSSDRRGMSRGQMMQDDDDGWRGHHRRMGRDMDDDDQRSHRGHMMQDDDDGWRGHHRRMGRDMDDDDQHMRHGRMNHDYDRRSAWRDDDQDDRYDRRRSRDMMSDRMSDRMYSWRRDCGPRYDRRDDRD
jgi:hypothetical protein